MVSMNTRYIPQRLRPGQATLHMQVAYMDGSRMLHGQVVEIEAGQPRRCVVQVGRKRIARPESELSAARGTEE
jgi:uncharacterized protein YabE (DUF348 family)